MGRLGFLFCIENSDEKKFVVVFIENEKIINNTILGIENLKVEQTKFYILDSNYDLENFFVFENALFKFGKICVGHKKIVDFRDFVFWFKAKEYTKIRELLLITNNVNKNVKIDIKKELRKRVLELGNIVGKYLK